ncbi:MAG: DUF6452 family protein [Flavobacteriaceae bacterium]
MKRFLFLTLLALLCFGALSKCEKDDICPQGTPTTPMVVIDFYEYLNPSVKKGFQKVEVIEIDNPNSILVFENTDRILLPLRTDSPQSNYIFRLTYININTEVTNEDLVEIRYEKEDIYLSRACGYKSNFTLLDSEPLNPNPKVSDYGNDEFWIKEYIVRQPVITNENETHLDILF